MKMFVWLFIAVVILVVVFGASVFNKLVRARNQAKNGFAQIDVQLKRRHDLIPNLVETAKRYLTHEEETLTRVISARNHAQSLQILASISQIRLSIWRYLPRLRACYPKP